MTAAHDSTFMRACRREAVPRTPVWFMRQAGRSQPGYRRLRERYSFLDIAWSPELCSQVTIEPLTTLGVDAVVMFADIVSPLIAAGLEIDIPDTGGPVLNNLVTSARDVAALPGLDPGSDLTPLTDAVQLVRTQVGPQVGIIDFVAGPFTLAAYLTEARGDGPRTTAPTQALMREQPAVWDALMTRITNLLVPYLEAKAAAGADALMIFDTLVGHLRPSDYCRHVRPHVRALLSAVTSLGPSVIHFGVGTRDLLSLMRDDGAGVIGIDASVPLDVAWSLVGAEHAVQGNLDPTALLQGWDEVSRQADDVLRRAAGRPGHIFNLGHGVLPETPLATLRRLVDLVHEHPVGAAVAGPAVPTALR